MNLLPILSLLKSENLHVKCFIEDENLNVVHIVWTNNPTPLSQDPLFPTHQFKAESTVYINFSKFLHLWDGETDPKYTQTIQNMRSEKSVRSAIESVFELHLTTILPLLDKGDYDAIKELFYVKRGKVVGDAFGF